VICASAAAGEIRCANPIRRLVVGENFSFLPVGAHDLEAGVDAQALYQVIWDRQTLAELSGFAADRTETARGDGVDDALVGDLSFDRATGEDRPTSQ
jgi:hypothetical protein